VHDSVREIAGREIENEDTDDDLDYLWQGHAAE